MIIKKSAVTVLKTLVVLVGLTTLMTTNSLFLADRSQALPPGGPIIPKISPTKMKFHGTIQGRITSTESSSNLVACNQITVTLIKYIPVKPDGGLYSDDTNKLGEVIASGENLASGCNYQISYFSNGKSTQYAYGYSSFGLVASIKENSYWYGRDRFKDIPSSSDLSMRYSPLH